AERAHLAVLPLADLLRQEAEGVEGGGARAAEAPPTGGRAAAAQGTPAAGARPRLDGARDRRPDVPQLAAAGAVRLRPEAAAGQRPLRPRPGRRAAEAARLQGAVPARGADDPRALLLSRHAPDGQARTALLDRRPRPPQGDPARLPD